MCISKQNPEGYPDLTAYEALSRVMDEKAFKPLVFICSPFAGEVETNVMNARAYCRFAVEQNCIPLAPHLLYPQFMDDSDREERALALFFCKVLLGKCAELWVFGDRVTSGMASEIARARFRNIPVRCFNSACEEAVQL